MTDHDAINFLLWLRSHLNRQGQAQFDRKKNLWSWLNDVDKSEDGHIEIGGWYSDSALPVTGHWPMLLDDNGRLGQPPCGWDAAFAYVLANHEHIEQVQHDVLLNMKSRKETT